MQHKIGEYLFDSDRLIVYKGNVDQKTTILIDANCNSNLQ